MRTPLLFTALCCAGQLVVSSQRAPSVSAQAAAATVRKPTVAVASISMASIASNLSIDIDRSMKARRDLAWSIVQKVWTPVGPTGSQVPAWMTWYQQDDLEPLFRDYLAERAGPSRASPVSAASQALAKHAQTDLQRSLSSARLGKSLRQFSFPEFTALNTHAKPGTGNIFYNPAYVAHLLANAERIASYRSAAFQPKHSGLEVSQQQGVRRNGSAAPDNAYALSMASEMPSDALMIKTAWVPVERGADSYYSDGRGLAKGFGESATGNFDLIMFPNSTRPFTYKIATPNYTSGAARVVVVSDETGQQWALLGMHIASKVRRTWLWITLMWLAPRAPWWEADRPAFFTEHESDRQPWLTWPLEQYGMAVASTFTESDPRPWAAYDRVPETNNIGPNADLHSMATSFKDLAHAMKGLQWCANPFIEVGMAHTNCIGCHQGSPNEFLATTLTKKRSTNVGDFSFSIATNREMFLRVMKERRPSG